MKAPHQSEEPTQEVQFSLDQGECWHTIRLAEALDVISIRPGPHCPALLPQLLPSVVWEPVILCLGIAFLALLTPKCNCCQWTAPALQELQSWCPGGSLDSSPFALSVRCIIVIQGGAII